MVWKQTICNKTLDLSDICHFICFFSNVLKCGEWPYLFATIVANEKILLDIAALKSLKPFV